MLQLVHNIRIHTGQQKVLRSADLQRVDPGVDALACHCSDDKSFRKRVEMK